MFPSCQAGWAAGVGPDSEALVFVPTPEAVRFVAKALPLVGAGACALQLRGPPGSGKTVRPKSETIP